jgi:hypothetical protein
MNKFQKQIHRFTSPFTMDKAFTVEYYLHLITLWRDLFGFIDFHSISPRGILLRHDIDNDLDKAVRMAELEAGRHDNLNRSMFEHGDHAIVLSTYFALNTAKYWGSHDMADALRYIQMLGHEIGWHNNAITEHIKTGKNIYDCVIEPLDHLRGLGLTITGSAAHGDRLCKIYRYHNYNIFGFSSAGWLYWNITPLDMKFFGLEYEAYQVPYENYLADCHTGWNGHNDVVLWNTNKRHQIIIHPQNWKI